MPRRFGDRWEVVRPLGEGGQAHTFQVRDLTDGTSAWVLKRLKNPKRLERFEREITALSRLDSRHVPRVVDYSVGEVAYLVTPYAGEDLASLREEHPSPQALLERFRCIVVAAADAHAVGLVHRDIKPDNVAVGADGTPYLLDFGICADDVSEVVLTTTTEGFGNRAFAAPECEPGSLDAAGPASDVYSLGKLLYWMASGGCVMVRERFDETSIAVEDHHARSFISRLIRRTAVEAPYQRWTTTELLDAIDWSLAKLEEHAALSRDGLIVVRDGFGPSGACYAGGSRSATTPPRGNPPADHDVAEAFTTTDAVRLDRLDLALRLHGGSGRTELLLVPDDQGRPSGEELERWEVEAGMPGEVVIVRVTPSKRIGLAGHETYWVVVSALDPDSDIAWVSAAIELSPRLARFAERDLPADWSVAESPGGPGHALRVLARMD